jgi:hypothetical protein
LKNVARFVEIVWRSTEEEEDRAMSRDYPMSSEEHYTVYFQDETIDWDYCGITHSQLIEDSLSGDKLLTDTQIGVTVRKLKEIEMGEEGIPQQEWHRFDEEGRYMSSYTAQELGAEWRQGYQDSYYSQ